MFSQCTTAGEGAARGVRRIHHQHKNEPSNEENLRQRVKRLERHHLFLSIAVMLLAIVNLRLIFVDRLIIDVLQLITENLDFVCQQIYSITDSIQRIL